AKYQSRRASSHRHRAISPNIRAASSITVFLSCARSTLALATPAPSPPFGGLSPIKISQPTPLSRSVTPVRCLVDVRRSSRALLPSHASREAGGPDNETINNTAIMCCRRCAHVRPRRLGDGGGPAGQARHAAEGPSAARGQRLDRLLHRRPRRLRLGTAGHQRLGFESVEPGDRHLLVHRARGRGSFLPFAETQG